MARILFIMTGSDHWTLNDGTTTPTGYWAEEAIVPLQAFVAASHEVVVATPGGIKSPLDPASLRVEDGDHYRRIDAASPALNHPVPLDSVSAADFDAVYVPGGHGPMEDLAVDAVSGALLTAFRDAAKPVGAVCHGPAALLAATRADGTNTFAGSTITCFTNEEETLAGSAPRAPWLLQTRLEEAGVAVRTAAPFDDHLETDGDLITGQNPASSASFAAALIQRLG